MPHSSLKGDRFGNPWRVMFMTLAWHDQNKCLTTGDTAIHISCVYLAEERMCVPKNSDEVDNKLYWIKEKHAWPLTRGHSPFILNHKMKIQANMSRLPAVAGTQRGDWECWGRPITPRLLCTTMWCSLDQRREEGVQGRSYACRTLSVLQQDAGPGRELLLLREELFSILYQFM